MEGTLFFAGGFLFDAVMVDRIDETPMLLQQFAYLVLTGALLALTQYYALKQREPPRALRKVWSYTDHAIHFMLGTLLNAYTIFYFQSASGLTAVGFLLVVAALLAVNELPRFHRLGPVMVYALYSICLTSYFAYLIPVRAHSVAPWMFYCAVGLSLIPIALFVRVLGVWSGNPQYGLRMAGLPALGVQALFVLSYALRIAPPVPLAVKEIGIYHDVRKDPEGRGKLLSHESHGLRFWQKGDQNYLEREGDKVWVFARVFAPRGFHDTIYAAWFYDHPTRGWSQVHRLGLKVTQSGERGFATEAFLTSPPEGKYRVEIQSADGRAMGLLRFEVTRDPSDEPRLFTEDLSLSRGPKDKRD